MRIPNSRSPVIPYKKSIDPLKRLKMELKGYLINSEN
jgi:hypothetical protein